MSAKALIIPRQNLELALQQFIDSDTFNRPIDELRAHFKAIGKPKSTKLLTQKFIDAVMAHYEHHHLYCPCAYFMLEGWGQIMKTPSNRTKPQPYRTRGTTLYKGTSIPSSLRTRVYPSHPETLILPSWLEFDLQPHHDRKLKTKGKFDVEKSTLLPTELPYIFWMWLATNLYEEKNYQGRSHEFVIGRDFINESLSTSVDTFLNQQTGIEGVSIIACAHTGGEIHEYLSTTPIDGKNNTYQQMVDKQHKPKSRQILGTNLFDF